MKEIFRIALSDSPKDLLNKKDLIHNEESTKQALINPVLLLLGYDIHNPNEV